MISLSQSTARKGGEWLGGKELGDAEFIQEVLLVNHYSLFAALFPPSF